MTAKKKKDLILEWIRQDGLTRLGEAEARTIQKRLVEALGEQGRCSRGYLARVAAEAGIAVQISDPFAAPVMEEPYKQIFEGALKFGTLEQAEHSLRLIGRRYREFKKVGDKKGRTYARALALLGKRRAQAAARRAKSEEARELKTEIANWFSLWLSAPDLFNDWVELRKLSQEFRTKWGSVGSQSEGPSEQ